MQEVTNKVLASITDHVDEAYNRLKKRVRKFDGQFSEAKQTLDLTQTQLANLTTSITQEITDLAIKTQKNQADVENQVQGGCS